MKEDRHFFDDSDYVPGDEELGLLVTATLGAFVVVAVGICLIAA